MAFNKKNSNHLLNACKRPSSLSLTKLAFVVISASFFFNLISDNNNYKANALSLISEKCDPNKVGPDETTVKGGWQAEMFNGLSFRACEKSCMPDSNRNAIVNCFKQHSPRAYNFYKQCTRNATVECTSESKQEIHVCLATVSQAFVQKEKCGQILNEATIKCLTPQITDQIELCFIRENMSSSNKPALSHQPVSSSPQSPGAQSSSVVHHAHSANHSSPHSISGPPAAVAGSAASASAAAAAAAAAASAGNAPQEVIVQSPRPAKAFLKQFEYANYDTLTHKCDPELEFEQQITPQEVTEIQAFYTIASTLCRDECLPTETKIQMRECLVKNSPKGAEIYNLCNEFLGPVCTPQNEENLSACYNTAAQNMTMNEKCVELVSDTTQKCWSQLITNETTHCVERKNLQTVSFEYGKVCNSSSFALRPKEDQMQIILAHKTNQENLLRRALETMCFPNCVKDDQREKMIRCLAKDSPHAIQIYETCSKQSKIKCDMEENIESYAEYVNCMYSEADRIARQQTTCVNLIHQQSFKCLEGLYPNEIFHCPDVRAFHEAQAEAISHHAAELAQLEELDYETN